MDTLLRIRGMVCPRCIQTVKTLFVEEGFPVRDVRLGLVTYRAGDAPRDLARVEQRLAAEGFALLDDKQTRTISRLKELVDAWILLGPEHQGTLAEYVSNALHQNYHSLTTLFSATQSLTLERHVIGRRVELARQYLCTSDDTLAVIADRLGYSSSQHFSNQFKRETGLTPAQYRNTAREKPAG